ncbi:MAG: hypothetical protein AAF957_25635 [Planctomycetota bacterium]
MRYLTCLPAAAALTAALAPAPALGQDIRVLTLDPSRSVVCSTLDFDLGQGNAFSELRSWLADPARFGPGGVVPRGTAYAPQALLLDPPTLETADVVLLTTMSRPLLRCEVDELLEFVRQGGGVFAFSNTATLDFNDATGAVSGGVGASVSATIVDPASAVAAGPFGTVTGSIGNLAFHRVLSDVGPNGNAILATSDTAMAEYTFGAGRLVVFGDEEWAMNGVVNGCAAGQQPEAARRTLWLNAFASVVPPVGFRYVPNPSSLGTRYCTPANLNSRGLPATICAFGSDVAADNDVTVAVDWIAPNAFGYFLVSAVQDFVAFPGGSQGNICLGNPVGRFIGPNEIQNSGAGGFFTLQLDLTSIPQPNGFISIQSGETWNFQAWYRDANPGATSNFTDALAVTFQ